MGLYGGMPTIEQLFGQVFSQAINQAGRSSSSKGSITFTQNPESPYHDGVYYLFFAAGGSFEVSRLDVYDEAFQSKTLLACASESGATKHYTSISNDGKSIVSDSVYSGNMSIYEFYKFSPDVVDAMLTNTKYTILKSRLSSSLTNTDANLQTPKANIGSEGVVIASYRDVPSGGTYLGGTQCSVFHVSTAATVPQKLKCFGTTDENPYTVWTGSIHGLKEVTTSGVEYILPVSTGQDDSANARVRSYTLVQLEETWEEAQE